MDDREALVPYYDLAGQPIPAKLRRLVIARVLKSDAHGAEAVKTLSYKVLETLRQPNSIAYSA